MSGGWDSISHSHGLRHVFLCIYIPRVSNHLVVRPDSNILLNWNPRVGNPARKEVVPTEIADTGKYRPAAFWHSHNAPQRSDTLPDNGLCILGRAASRYVSGRRRAGHRNRRPDIRRARIESHPWCVSLCRTSSSRCYQHKRPGHPACVVTRCDSRVSNRSRPVLAYSQRYAAGGRPRSPPIVPRNRYARRAVCRIEFRLASAKQKSVADCWGFPWSKRFISTKINRIFEM